MNVFKNLKAHPLILLILAAFIFRILLSFYGVHPDIYSQASWGIWIYQHGPFGLYDHNEWVYEWPSQLPLVNFLYAYTLNLLDSSRSLLSNFGNFIAFNHLGASHILWYYDFITWFGTAKIPMTNIYIGQVFFIKLFAILADIGLAIMIYKVLKSKLSLNKSLILTAIFLFLPSTWYLSASWGQYDQIGALLFIASILLLYKKQFILSSLIFALAFQIKPTIILFSPFYLFYFFFQKPSLLHLLISVITALLTNILLTLPFTGTEKFFESPLSVYLKSLIYRRAAYLTNHAFNLWIIIFPEGRNVSLGNLSFFLGHFLTILFNIAAAALLFFKKDRTLKSLLVSLYIVTAGSYIFGLGMLDRYFFPAIVALTLNLTFFPKLFYPWLLTSLLFSFNLFYSWGFPVWPYDQAWNNLFIVRIMGILQIVLFIYNLKIMLPKLFENLPRLKRN